MTPIHIFSVGEPSPPRAEQCHDDLVAALQKVVAWAEGAERGTLGPTLTVVRQALAKAAAS